MISSKPYLMYASPSNGFGLCEWQGVSGFGACAEMQTTDTSAIEPIITAHGAYTVAGTRDSIAVYKTSFGGNREQYTGDVC